MNLRPNERVLYKAVNLVNIILFVLSLIIFIAYVIYITCFEEKGSPTLFDKFMVLFMTAGFLLIGILSQIYKPYLLVVCESYMKGNVILMTQRRNNIPYPTDILRFEEIEYVRYHKKKPLCYLEIRDKNGLDYYFGKGINLEKLAPILKRLLPDKFEEVRE